MLISICLDPLLNPACKPKTRRQAINALSNWQSKALLGQDVVILYDRNTNQTLVEKLVNDLKEIGCSQDHWKLRSWQPLAGGRTLVNANQCLKLGIARWLGAKAHIEVATWPKSTIKCELIQALFIVEEGCKPNQLQRFMQRGGRETISRTLAEYESFAISEDHIASRLLKPKHRTMGDIHHLPTILLELAREQKKCNRPSLAWVSPMPPDRTGIAEYANSLVPGLIDHYDITVITDSNYTAKMHGVKATRNSMWFRRNGWRFEQICYHIGNSPYHLEIVESLKVWPGAVVMHEVYIGDLMYKISKRGSSDRQWLQSLYQTDGYQALMASATEHGAPQRTLQEFACNGELIERSLGVIVHSQHAENMIRKNVVKDANLLIAVVPMCRQKRELPNREYARNKLGLDQDTLLICSFGMTGEAKMSVEIAKAWKKTAVRIMGDKTKLSFVGANDSGSYGEKLKAQLDQNYSANCIEITGWISDKIYNYYLAACDISIQIRAASRGETSAAIYDVLCAGIPTIANKHGSMAELPKEHTVFISARPNEAEIQAALEKLVASNRTERERLKHILPSLWLKQSPAAGSQSYVDSLKAIYSGKRAIESQLITEIASKVSRRHKSLAGVSNTIAKNFTRGRAKRQLLVDVSQIKRTDHKTGIQRVVRSLVIELINMKIKDFRVEPVWLSTAGAGWHYRYAREWTTNLINLTGCELGDSSVEPGKGDILLLADLTGSYLLEAHKSGVYEDMKSSGVDIKAIVYDILPLQLPNCFPAGSEETHRNWLKVVSTISTSLLCISKAVAIDTEIWLRQEEPDVMDNLEIDWFHLGADIDNSSPTRGLPKDLKKLKQYLKNRVSFLMVGTVEPRKGYQQAVKAFELLLKKETPYNLIIIGKKGWMMNSFADALKASEFYNAGIFWYDSASDEFLEWLYNQCNCLIVASNGEGFGLPLIEAAKHNMPILARDLPVFREIAQDGAAYFTGIDPKDLASAIDKWAGYYQNGLHQDPKNLNWITWEESAMQVVQQMGLEITK